MGIAAGMSIKHLRNEAGGNPARGPHPDQANPATGKGNDFPDHEAEAVADRPQDQPDLDAFAARMGTDSIAGRDATSMTDSVSDDTETTEATTGAAPTGDAGSDAATDDGTREAGAWRASAATVLGGMATGAKSVASGLGSLAHRVTTQSTDDIDLAALRKRVDGIRTVMVTTADEQGALASRPLTVQRVSDDGDVLFVVDQDADWVTSDSGPANVAFVDDGSTWVSVSGPSEVRDDTALLDELWNPILDTFFPNGRDSAAIFEVRADRWEYWTAPNKLTQLVEIVSSKINDDEPDLGDSGTIET